MTESVIMTRLCDMMELTVPPSQLSRFGGVPRLVTGELLGVDELAGPDEAAQGSWGCSES